MEDRVQRQIREAGQGVYGPSDSWKRGYVTKTSSATVTSYAMKVYDFVVELIMVASYPITITLPPVAEAKGKIYTIYCSTHGESSCDVTIADAGDDAIFSDSGSDVTLAYLNNYVVLFSNGKRWFVLASHLVT